VQTLIRGGNRPEEFLVKNYEDRGGKYRSRRRDVSRGSGFDIEHPTGESAPGPRGKGIGASREKGIKRESNEPRNLGLKEGEGFQNPKEGTYLAAHCFDAVRGLDRSNNAKRLAGRQELPRES